MGKGNRAKGKKKTVNVESLVAKLQPALDACVINRNQGALLVSRVRALVQAVSSQKDKDKDYSKAVEKLVSDVSIVLEESSSSEGAHLKLILDPKFKGSNRSKYSVLMEEILKLRKEVESGVEEEGDDIKGDEKSESKVDAADNSSADDDQAALDDAEFNDLKEIEILASSLQEDLLKELKSGVKQGMTPDKVKVLLDIKLEAIRKRRIIVGFSVISSLNVSSLPEASVFEQTKSLFLLFETGVSKVVKPNPAWKASVVNASRLSDFVNCLIDIDQRIDTAKISPSWQALQEIWARGVQSVNNLNLLSPYLLELESLIPLNLHSPAWSSVRQQWINIAVKLSLLDNESTTLLFAKQLAFLEQHLNISGGWSNSRSKWLGVTLSEASIRGLCGSLSELASALEQSRGALSRAWDSASIPWKARLSHCESFNTLSDLLMELEAHCNWESLAADWAHLRVSWLKRLSVRAVDPSDLEKLKDCVIEYERCMSGRAFEETAQDRESRASFRRGVKDCTLALDVARYLVDLESRITKECLGNDWSSEYAPYWREALMNSTTASQVAILFYDLQLWTNPHMTKAWVESEKTMGTRLKSLTIANAEGRLAAVKLFNLVDLESRITKECLGNDWSSEYAPYWREALMNSTTASQVAILFYDLQLWTNPHMTKAWVESEKTMGTRLKSLTIANAEGRLAAVKSSLTSLEIYTNHEVSMKPEWKEVRSRWLFSLARARTSMEAGTLFRDFIANTDENGPIGTQGKAQSMYRAELTTQALEPRNVCQMLLQFGENSDASFFKPSWRNMKFRFTSLLRLVNKELVSEGIITILKNFLLLLQKGIQASAFESSWRNLSDSWGAGVVAQTSVEKLGHYLIALESHISRDSIHPVWSELRQAWADYTVNTSFSNGSFCAGVLLFVSNLHPSSFNRPYWEFTELLWSQIYQDVALEDSLGHIEILKWASSLLASFEKKGSSELNALILSGQGTIVETASKILEVNASTVTELAAALLKKKSKAKVDARWPSFLDALLLDVNNPAKALYASVRSMKGYAAGFFAHIKGSCFGQDPRFAGDEEKGVSSTGYHKRANFFRDADNSVSGLANRVLQCVNALDLETFESQYHGDILTSVKYTLKNADSAFDIGGCLRTMDLYVKNSAYLLPYDEYWHTIRPGFLQGLKRYEMFELKYIQEFQRAVYDLVEDEAGHTTIGHNVVDERDKAEAEATGSDLLFGELLVDGVSKCVDRLHMDAPRATSLCDLGMGLGKLAMQAWLMHKNLKYTLGVELARTRYALGEEACLRMVKKFPHEYKLLFHEKMDPKRLRIAIEDSLGRVLEFRKQDLFLVKDELEKGGLCADIIITETHFPEATVIKLCKHLNGMKKGARLLTYENLHECYANEIVGIPMPFKQLEVNVSEEDRFPTTWSTVRGHHFYLWEKLTDPHVNEKH
eukprot:TRINITY_DN7182_c0_g2_i1.p1 TRINITY_DN7182_c0_g2~~TRINITY_DN7182_c0_g2_i1.p1  ORF type:complete len:1432 (-),score=401.37 TRINITY_DN7182_c0_g2_i1:62-4357(-)